MANLWLLTNGRIQVLTQMTFMGWFMRNFHLELKDLLAPLKETYKEDGFARKNQVLISTR